MTFSTHFARALLPVAVGAAPSTVELIVAAATPTVTTASREFLEAVAKVPSFAWVQWNERVRVPVTTLDELIAQLLVHKIHFSLFHFRWKISAWHFAFVFHLFLHLLKRPPDALLLGSHLRQLFRKLSPRFATVFQFLNFLIQLLLHVTQTLLTFLRFTFFH